MLVVELEEADFVANVDYYEKLQALVRQSFEARSTLCEVVIISN